MITIKGIRKFEQLRDYISELPRHIRGLATRDAAIYLIGNTRRGLQHYPNRVEHGADNPYQWQSEKQRRAYFASNGFGKGIPYNRSYDLRAGWTYIEKGVNTQIVNDVPYAGFVMGDEGQQVGHRADGWRKIADIIKTNINGMIAEVDKAIQRYINKTEPK